MGTFQAPKLQDFLPDTVRSCWTRLIFSSVIAAVPIKSRYSCYLDSSDVYNPMICTPDSINCTFFRPLDDTPVFRQFKFSFLFKIFTFVQVSIIRFSNLLQPLVDGYPWGSKSPSNSDPYNDAPNTGVVRSYDFTLTRGVLSPDGFEKSTFLINDQFPGVNLPRIYLRNIST